ncbi:hypothetical protein M9H77_07046 [Catharanthus roseus]|uniref:Uncharacterized protein n=1 Tax=Catharanthus roseus TaxID=4058 RepID=A0ACC0BTV0_CATRO|nr:hypothetical protein M9H77_07046 [Catharanthus roseus]
MVQPEARGSDDDLGPVTDRTGQVESRTVTVSSSCGLRGRHMMSKIDGSRQKRPEKSRPPTNPTQRKKATNDESRGPPVTFWDLVGEGDRHKHLGEGAEGATVAENMIGDGNCGYWVMADFMFDDEHQWPEVRRQMLYELEHSTNYRNHHGMLKAIASALSVHSQPVCVICRGDGIWDGGLVVPYLDNKIPERRHRLEDAPQIRVIIR